jgi:hypothetical protein
LFLLESVEGGEVWPLYSFLGADPLMVLTAKSGRLTLRSLSIGNENSGFVRLVWSVGVPPPLRAWAASGAARRANATTSATVHAFIAAPSALRLPLAVRRRPR